MKQTLLLIIFTISIFFSFSCKKEKKNVPEKTKDSVLVTDIPSVVKVKDKLFSVPSPMALSNFVKKQNIPFDKSFINTPENYTKYITTFKESLNIGAYGADLAELFVYDQLSESAQYFNVIKKLSEEVGVMNSINQKLIDRIQQNSNNKDSLMFIVSEIYREIDNYLLENDQQDVGILILAGGWIESIYYLTQILKQEKNPDLVSRLAEQKNPLNNIIELMHPYYNKKSKDFDKLMEKLVNLSIIFDAIEENYSYSPPKTDPVRKITYIHSTTTYNVSQAQLKTISEKVDSIRNWIIQ